MNVGATFGNLSWLAASLPEYRRFKRDARNLEATQRNQLHHYLRRNADTDFGLQHNFASINSWEEFAEQVPVRDYDDFEPWISRIAAGELKVLTQDPVRLFEPSSGSSGPAKLIPYTQSLQREIRKGVAVWSAHNFLSQPELLSGRSYWSLTPQMGAMESTESGIPIGFDEDSAYLGGITQYLINHTLATKSALRLVTDMDVFWHVTLLMLLQCKDLRFMSVWHPSYLALLIAHMRRNWPSLLQDLESGYSLNSPSLRIHRSPARADELQSAGCDNLHLIWPKLRTISCWTDGHAATYIPQLRSLFPEATLQAKGLLATEGFVTIPHGTLRPLAIRSHVFEFLDSDNNAYAPWQIEKGKEYTVVITTGGGLYRYRLGDRIRVDDFFGDVPSLRFIGKEDQVSDFYGEKLNENFVAGIFSELFSKNKMNSRFALLAIEETLPTPSYVLYLELDGDTPDSLALQLDQALRKNPHYDLCIRLGQLGNARIARVRNDAFDLYAERLSEMGTRLGNIKPTPLSRHSGWHQCFGIEN
jgi:hypothetical protein